MAGAPPPPSTASAEGPTPSLIVRRRTRAITDEAERLSIALRMKARGCTRAEMARALNLHPSTVAEIVRRASDNAIERVRSETVEELVAQRRAERDMRAQKLTAILEQAELRRDVRTQLDALRELRQEGKEDREWMRELGAFDRYRIPTIADRDKAISEHSSKDLLDAVREFATMLASGDSDVSLPLDLDTAGGRA